MFLYRKPCHQFIDIKTASIYGSDTLHPSTVTLFRLLLVEGCRVPSLVKLPSYWNRSLVPDSGFAFRLPFKV